MSGDYHPNRAAWRTVPLLGSLAVLVAVSCQNDRKNLVGLAPRGNAHVPVSFAIAQTPSGATFTTDKDDYAPGVTLKLAGEGWQAGDSLDLLLDETPQNHPPVAWAVGVDTSGAFRDSSYVVQESDAGVTFALTATSRATGDTATATFTDGNIRVRSNLLGVTFQLTAQKFTTSLNCSTGAQTPSTSTATSGGTTFSPSGPSRNNPGGESWQFTAAPTSDQGAALKSPPWNLDGTN